MGKKKMILIILIIVLCIVAMAILPFLFHPKIKKTTEKSVSEKVFTGETQGNERAAVLEENGNALEERIRLISQAKEEIILSTFEFRSDESGKTMLSALDDAAKRGVTVKILIDGMSGLTNMRNNPYFCALSAMENVEVRIYNPISLWKPWRLMGRMHDKYLIIDDWAYILGGRNTYDYFLGAQKGYKNYDWDVLVYKEGNGESASMNQLKEYFQSVWELPLCKVYHDDVRELEKEKVIQAKQELQEKYQSLQQENPAWFEMCDYVEKTKPTNHIELVSNPIHSNVKEPTAFYTITELMRQAKNEVKFHTPYIICNKWMLERLEKACAEVPKVTMMTNSIANNGNPFGALDYRRNKKKILDTGVQILEYDGGISYHGKCFTIDDRLSGIGSLNWDMRSAYIDTETMLVIDSKEVNEELKIKMEEYEKKALTVIDKDTSEVPEGMTPQKIKPKRLARIVVLSIIAWWARFLM